MVQVFKFGAEWCGPCKVINPIFDRLQSKFSDRVEFRILDVDEDFDMAQMYHIRSIPTVLVLKDGNIVDRIGGSKTESHYIEAIESVI